jgi:hypothetical protein
MESVCVQAMRAQMGQRARGAMALLKGWRNTRARVWAAGEAASP